MYVSTVAWQGISQKFKNNFFVELLRATHWTDYDLIVKKEKKNQDLNSEREIYSEKKKFRI